MGLRKFFLILFVFLSLIILSELGYYFFFTTTKPNQSQATQPITPYIKERESDIIVSRVVVSKYKGTILDISTKAGVAPSTNFKYEVMISIVGTAKPIIIYYSKNDLKVVRIVDSANKPLNFENLKVGDKIVIDETLDRKADLDNNLIKLVITKI